ncbi:EAL domain-containing protein [Oxalobacteraceae bacterium OM1]|nr:EAL domain-containing protein [Oxalobacteraceae bacterium OM1]
MPKSTPEQSTSLFHRAAALTSALLDTVALYVVPVLIAAVSLLALAAWEDYYQPRGERKLHLQAAAEADRPFTLEQALAATRAANPAISHETRLSENPVWFAFSTPPAGHGSYAIEFPSRHAAEIACWDARSLEPLGLASHGRATGMLRPAKAGFIMEPVAAEAELLCRTQAFGPATLSVTLWPSDELKTSTRQYHRKSGLLDGGLIVLAVFVLLTALINRQSLYVLFAAWLVLNLRLGALSAGWDVQWLGQTVPEALIVPMRKITIALYSITTVALYLRLFGDSMRERFFAPVMRLMYWLCLPLLVGAFVLPFTPFLELMWVITGTGLVVMSICLADIAYRTRTRVAMWYAASLGVTYLSGLSEVLAASFGVRELVGIANSVTAALASSVLAALAIAEEMRIEHTRRLEAQAELEHTYEAMPVGLFTLDGSGRFLSFNPALQAMLGCDLTLPANNRWKRHFTPGAWTRLHQMVDSQSDGELEITSRDGSRCFLVKATLAHGKIEGFLQDVTEKARAAEDLRFLANNDPLTKVFNRRGISKIFEAAREQQVAGKPLTLAYLDLDRFKLINDLFGHSAGDVVLQQVCERIGTMLARGQHIGRVGGDEFVIVMPDTAVPLASLICRGIINCIGNTPYRVGDKAFHVRGSIGLVEVGPAMDWQDAVSTADRACRDAKTSHSEGLTVYEKDATALHERKAELDLMSHLSLDGATDGLFIEMQPIMSLKAPRGSLNVEVLLRMRGGDGSIIPASRIIGAAEKSGRTGTIDRWVLSTTLAWLNAHPLQRERTHFVCLNLSGASLNDERFVEDTIDMLQDHPESAKRLCIEITESVALHDLENTRRFINAVRSYGAKVGLDDFGAGYTSFSYLKELPADVLKIDGSFVVNINEHPANVAIVEAIVNLATNLGMKTIAEWAEDNATVQTLAEIGVDYVQGYAIARSRPLDEILEAESSASFIKDDALLRLVEALGRERAASQAELIELARLRGVH